MPNSWLSPTLQEELVLPIASTVFNIKWSAMSNWRRGSTTATVPLNQLTLFWKQPGCYKSGWWRREEGIGCLRLKADSVPSVVANHCVANRKNPGGSPQPSSLRATKPICEGGKCSGTCQWLQYRHTHKQRGSLSPCSRHLLTFYFS